MNFLAIIHHSSFIIPYMPVEIKELVIRMNGTNNQPSGTASQGSTAPAQPAPNQEAVVEACVKEVLRILEKKKVR